MSFFRFKKQDDRIIAESDVTDLFREYMPMSLVKTQVINRIIGMIDELSHEVVKQERQKIIAALAEDFARTAFAKLATKSSLDDLP